MNDPSGSTSWERNKRYLTGRHEFLPPVVPPCGRGWDNKGLMVKDNGRRIRAERGQSLVEFALVLPLILLLILGMIDFGVAFNYNNDQNSLANEAIRFAVVGKCAACTAAGESIEQYVKNDADSGNLKNGGTGIGIQTPGVTVTFCSPGYAGGGLAVGQPLTARVEAQYRFLPYIISKLGIPTIVNLDATVVQRLEATYDGDGTDQYTVVAC